MNKIGGLMAYAFWIIVGIAIGILFFCPIYNKLFAG